MNSDELCFLTIPEALKRIRAGRLSPEDLVEAHLERISRIDPKLRSYMTVSAEIARKQARSATGPLRGIPISYKDLIDTAGIRTTSGSKAYQDRVPVKDAAVVAQLNAAGTVTLGKASLNEFAFGPTSESDFAKPVRNPWNTAASAGLSSSGSAAGVAAGLAMASIGSDSGGSIRIPSSFCGVTGLKPTYGRMGRTGVLALSYSLDHLGVLARSAEDVAYVLSAGSGPDPEDPASSARPVPPPSQLLQRPVRKLRLGVFPRYVEAVGAQKEVRDALENAVQIFQRQGAELREIEIPHLAYGAAADFTILRIEGFWAHLPAMRTHWQDYGRSALKNIAAGGLLTAMDYFRAQQARTLLSREVAKVFESCDLLLLPATPQAAAGGEWDRTPSDKKVARSSVAYLAPFNLTGNPALAFPGGFNAAGMPLGLQLIGRPFEEDAVLSAAHRYQQVTGWHNRRCNL